MTVSLVLSCGCAERQVHLRGIVTMCDGDAPISGAQVSAIQVSWGREHGNLVWDKTYSTLGFTGADGRFDLPYVSREGSVKITAVAAGFHLAEIHTRDNNANVRLRLVARSGSPIERVTYECEFLEDCAKTNSCRTTQ